MVNQIDPAISRQIGPQILRLGNTIAGIGVAIAVDDLPDPSGERMQ